MRLTVVSLVLVLSFPRALHAQMYTVGDTSSKRIRPGSCPLADGQLGEASKGVMKAEIHGSFGPDSLFQLASGPIEYHDELPATLTVTDRTAGHDSIPWGILEIWFKGDILSAERDPSKPFTLVVNDSLRFPLGMPPVPLIQGTEPDAAPFHVVITSKPLKALVLAKKARAEFLGKRTDFRHSAIEEFQGTVRLAICYRSGQGITR